MKANDEFFDCVREHFSFLLKLDFKIDPPFCFRDETSVSFKSSELMVYFFYSRAGNGYYCTIGKPEKHYPLKSVPITDIFKHYGVSFEYSEPITASLCDLANKMDEYLKGLLSGDLTVLEKLWSEQECDWEELKRYHQRIAMRTETIGNAEIFEISNTAESLGADFVAMFPGHDFGPSNTWLVYTKLGYVNCNSYEQAKNVVEDLG